ncbi:hypothetical protein [Halobacillus naozhouensis]
MLSFGMLIAVIIHRKQ